MRFRGQPANPLSRSARRRRRRRRRRLRHGLLSVEPPHAELHAGIALIEHRGKVPAVRTYVDLRLEALREADGAGYEVAVYRQETVQVSSACYTAGEPMRPLQEVRIWVAYDLIASVHSTAEAALEQVLGFLEMRCV
jgi:hypothetical protein